MIHTLRIFIALAPAGNGYVDFSFTAVRKNRAKFFLICPRITHTLSQYSDSSVSTVLLSCQLCGIIAHENNTACFKICYGVPSPEHV